jgi:hypothetical protein
LQRHWDAFKKFWVQTWANHAYKFCILNDLYGIHMHCRHMVIGRA